MITATTPPADSHTMHMRSTFVLVIFTQHPSKPLTRPKHPVCQSPRLAIAAPTHSDNVDKLVGDDCLTTSVVLELQGANHVTGVLRVSTQSQNKSFDLSQGHQGGQGDEKAPLNQVKIILTLEAFSIAVRLAEISAACPSTRAV